MQEAADDAKREAHAALDRESQAQARAEALDAARAAEQRKCAELQGDVNALMADGDAKARCALCMHVNLPCFTPLLNVRSSFQTHNASIQLALFSSRTFHLKQLYDH
jgi:hypothetical protein